MSGSRAAVLAGVVTLAAAACDFNPFSPTETFPGFDEKGSRVSGTFEAPASAQSVLALARGDENAAGIRVFLEEDPSLSVIVESDGTFVIIGVPAGSFTLVFERDGEVIGRIRFEGVRQNQEITIIVILVGGSVELVFEDRDEVPFEGECPRGAGFWCRGQSGANPSLSAEEFQELAEAAAELLSDVPALNAPEKIAVAVCDPRDELLRQLTALALNVAAETITMDEPLLGEEFATVGEAFDAAVALAQGGAGNRRMVRRVLRRVNENRNHEVCDPLPDDDDSDSDDGDGDPPGDDDDDDSDPGGGGGLTCHGAEIPPGQLPPPGSCKIWDPGVPPGQQGPPGDCDELEDQLRPGQCLVDHNGVVIEA